ncbi:MAG TPA: phosphopantetheine-binding protein [Gammaproteobacteria bacterium]|nr:phosphopantetheine-binding protein [Gammaproteobacteria bacterium]
MTDLELDVARLIVSALELEDISAEEIDPEARLFREGLGLDSIDALELSLAISKQYGVQLKSDNERDREAFRSLRALAAYISARQAENA